MILLMNLWIQWCYFLDFSFLNFYAIRVPSVECLSNVGWCRLPWDVFDLTEHRKHFVVSSQSSGRTSLDTLQKNYVVDVVSCWSIFWIVFKIAPLPLECQVHPQFIVVGGVQGCLWLSKRCHLPFEGLWLVLEFGRVYHHI